MSEFLLEGIVVIVGVFCVIGATFKVMSIRKVKDQLCQDLRRDWGAEIATYVVGVIFATGRAFDVVNTWPYWVTASLTLSICVANFTTSLLVWRRIKKIAEGTP